MKTPEELATDWIIENRVELLSNPCHSAFLAGYKAAQEYEKERNNIIKKRWIEAYDRLVEKEGK